MNIGNWYGGRGPRILLPVETNTAARQRRMQARRVAAMMREAGLHCNIVEQGDPINHPDFYDCAFSNCFGRAVPVGEFRGQKLYQCLECGCEVAHSDLLRASAKRLKPS